MVNGTIPATPMEQETLISETVFTAPYQNSVFFYVQSQSPRAWATFVTPTNIKPGLEYDASTLQVMVDEKLDETNNMVPVPVEVNIYRENKDRVKNIQLKTREGLTELSEVRFKNVFKNSPLTLAVGYYQYEAWKFTTQPGCSFVSVIPLVNPDETQRVVLNIILHSSP